MTMDYRFERKYGEKWTLSCRSERIVWTRLGRNTGPDVSGAAGLVLEHQIARSGVSILVRRRDRDHAMRRLSDWSLVVDPVVNRWLARFPAEIRVHHRVSRQKSKGSENVRTFRADLIIKFVNADNPAETKPTNCNNSQGSNTNFVTC